jgi:3-oxoacyl-[acyl-carrier-protein] synthase II
MRNSDSEVRLAITGMGIICSIGRNQSEVWDSITSSRAGIAPMVRFGGESFPTNLAAEAESDLYELMGGPRSELRRLSRTDLLALVAAREAIGQAAGIGLPSPERRSFPRGHRPAAFWRAKTTTSSG